MSVRLSNECPGIRKRGGPYAQRGIGAPSSLIFQNRAVSLAAGTSMQELLVCRQEIDLGIRIGECGMRNAD